MRWNEILLSVGQNLCAVEEGSGVFHQLFTPFAKRGSFDSEILGIVFTIDPRLRHYNALTCAKSFLSACMRFPCGASAPPVTHQAFVGMSVDAFATHIVETVCARHKNIPYDRRGNLMECAYYILLVTLGYRSVSGA